MKCLTNTHYTDLYAKPCKKFEDKRNEYYNN